MVQHRLNLFQKARRSVSTAATEARPHDAVSRNPRQKSRNALARCGEPAKWGAGAKTTGQTWT
jgi:hypothetical protein